MIQVNNYIQTAFSANDAEELLKVIQPMVDNSTEHILLDFSGIRLFTTLFFNNTLAKYVMTLGPAEYEHRFSVQNLSEIGQTTYQHSMENAKDYYNASVSDREEQDEILSDFDE